METKIWIVLAAILMTVSQKVYSQTDTSNRPPSWVGTTVGSTKEGASQTLMSEYAQIVSKYDITGKQWWIKFKENISADDRSRLELIYKQMNVEQQRRQKVAFIKPVPALKKVVPTDKEFQAWKDKQVYGIWINGKKVGNDILDEYSNTDFEQVTVHRLYGAAKRNKIYSYQVNLMTKTYYRSYYLKTTSKKENLMVFRA